MFVCEKPFRATEGFFVSALPPVCVGRAPDGYIGFRFLSSRWTIHARRLARPASVFASNQARV